MQQEPESATDRVVRKTPWWGISAGMHLTLAMVLGWIIVLQQPAESDGPIVVHKRTQCRPPVEFEKSIDLREPTPVKLETPSEEKTPFPDPNDPILEDPNGPTEGIAGQKEAAALELVNSRSNRAVIGAGATSTGRKGTGLNGREKRRPSGNGPGPTEQTEAAVERGLVWLAKHQSPPGCWKVEGYQAQCKGETCSNPTTVDKRFDVGLTGLALLAFLGAGYSHLSRDKFEGILVGDVVRQGIQWLLQQQRDDGQIGDGHVYNHAIATLALTEACGLTGSKLFETETQRAIDWLVAAQNPGSGWRYYSRGGESDGSVTGWCVMVFKSAKMSGFSFPDTVFDGARAWFDETTESDYYRVGYNRRGTGKVYCEHNQSFDHHESMAAISAMSRIFMDKNEHDIRVNGAASLLMRDLPKWETAAIDYYYWYYASLALFQLGGERFQKWNAALTMSLVKNQNLASSGCRNGSWEPVDRWSCEAGRVYATAINVLTLEVYYRYPSVFGGNR